MANRYWRGGDWNSTSSWSTTSGGLGGASIPTSADDVFLDSPSGTLNLNTTAYCRNFTHSAGFVTLNFNATLQVSGSWSSTLAFTGSGQWRFEGAAAGTYTIYQGPEILYRTHNGPFYLLNGSSSVIYRFTGYIRVNQFILNGSCKLDLNGYSLNTVHNCQIVDTSTLTFNGGSMISRAFDFSDTVTYIAGTGTGFIEPNSAFSTCSVTMSGTTNKALNCEVRTRGGITMTFFGPAQYLDLKKISAGQSSFIFPTTHTTTFSNFTASGDSLASPVVIRSDSAGTRATISKSSGTVAVSNLDIKDSAATGGATWNATSSIDSGNNTGWNITAPPKGNGLFFGSNF